MGKPVSTPCAWSNFLCCSHYMCVYIYCICIYHNYLLFHATAACLNYHISHIPSLRMNISTLSFRHITVAPIYFLNMLNTCFLAILHCKINQGSCEIPGITHSINTMKARCLMRSKFKLQDYNRG